MASACWVLFCVMAEWRGCLRCAQMGIVRVATWRCSCWHRLLRLGLLAAAGFAGCGLVCLQLLAGSRPGRRPPFLLHGKKGGKETCPTSSVPHCPAWRVNGGNLRPQQTAACGRTHCALKRSIQTAAASQITKFGCPAAAKPPPLVASAGAGSRVSGQPNSQNLQQPARAVPIYPSFF